MPTSVNQLQKFIFLVTNTTFFQEIYKNDKKYSIN